jgi:septal ring factor EnvC (AmiA/AmiB activator)
MMIDLEYSAMSQEQLLYAVDAKDAEIERLCNAGDTTWKLIHKLEARIEELEAALKTLTEQYCNKTIRIKELEAENAKLERVRDAAKSVAACEGQTLIGCAPENEYDLVTTPSNEQRAHEYGATNGGNRLGVLATHSRYENAGLGLSNRYS